MKVLEDGKFTRLPLTSQPPLLFFGNIYQEVIETHFLNPN